MRIDVKEKKECCGCTACMAVCPRQCIRMEPDEMGFLYPVIDEDACIDCGLCAKTCKFCLSSDEALVNLSQPSVYAVQYSDDDVLKKSQSGACFTAISDWVLAKGGVVYGAVYKGLNFNVTHTRAESACERNAMRGSKYSQSDLRGVFSDVRNDLKCGKWVLFTGTPCQVSGLSAYVGRALADKLILVDIICHGVASPVLWSDVIKYTESKYKSKVRSPKHRDKARFGWSGRTATFELEKNKVVYRPLVSIYNENVLRESCFNCRYSSLSRVGDITIGDFWGVEAVPHNIFEPVEKGVSLLLCNTPKGGDILKDIRQGMKVLQLNVEEALQMNLRESTKMPETYYDFKEKYKKGFEFAMRSYGYMGWRYEVSQFLFLVKMIVKKLSSNILKF